MKKEMKIVLPFYKIAYAVSFVVILSVIRAVVFTYEIGLSIEPPFAILTAVFCADTYVQEITSNRSEVQRLYQIKKRIYSIIQRLMIQGTFLLLLAVLGYGLFFAFQKPITHPVTESEILQFITCFGAIVVTIFFWGILANTLSMLFRNMWMGIGSSLLIWVATNSTGGDKLFGAWNLFSYSFRDIENTADITWLYGKGLCICIGLIFIQGNDDDMPGWAAAFLFLFYIGAPIAVGGGILVFKVLPEKTNQKRLISQGGIRYQKKLEPFNEQDFHHMSKVLESSGFNNVECINKHDVILGIFAKADQVETVSVDGKEITSGGKIYLPDTPITITNHGK